MRCSASAPTNGCCGRPVPNSKRSAAAAAWPVTSGWSGATTKCRWRWPSRRCCRRSGRPTRSPCCWPTASPAGPSWNSCPTGPASTWQNCSPSTYPSTSPLSEQGILVSSGFVPPPYPYERLGELSALADKLAGGAVDLSVGTPCDPPPPGVIAALADGDRARGYPPSIGTPALRRAAADWIERRLGATVDPDTELAACVGSKEFVASTPQY